MIPFSSHLQSFPASGSFQLSQFFASGGQSIGASASASVLPMNIQGWFPLELAGLISLQSNGSQESSPAPQFKSMFPSQGPNLHLLHLLFWQTDSLSLVSPEKSLEYYIVLFDKPSQVVLVVKNPPTNAGDMRRGWVQSLGQEDPLEEEMAIHSDILAGRIPRAEESGRLQSIESQKIGHNWNDLSCTHVIKRQQGLKGLTQTLK